MNALFRILGTSSQIPFITGYTDVICRCAIVDAPCYLSLDHSGCSLLSVAAPQWMLPVICRCTTVDALCKVEVDEILPVTHTSRHSSSYFVYTFQSSSCEYTRLYTSPWVTGSKQVRTRSSTDNTSEPTKRTDKALNRQLPSPPICRDMMANGMEAASDAHNNNIS